MKHSTEVLVKEALSRHPKPSASAGAVSEIVELCIRYEARRHSRPPWVARMILSGYWLAALIGTLAIVWFIPLPEWRPSALTTSLAWAIPVCGAILLLRQSILRVILDWSARYL